MLNSDQKIPCPVCKTSILFDAKQLMMGIQFVCSNCNASVGLAIESRDLVKDAMDKLEELKRKSPKK